MESAKPYLILAVVIVIPLIVYLVNHVRRGGSSAAMFGVPDLGVFGEISATSVRVKNVSVKLHNLGGNNDQKAIGLEFRASGATGYRMISVALSEVEARKLAAYLESKGANEKT
ncbi:hypothetical protein [Zooshikella sp. RANM57]|uniref:hypothetical protein n=1 Tax=Zooshikella sp. RANM57 TaxID=3425863 RepID=UPI003D6DDA38